MAADGTIVSVKVGLREGLFYGLGADPEQVENLSQVLLHEAIHAWVAEQTPEVSADPDCASCRELITDALTSSELCAAANDCDAPPDQSDRQALADGANEARERCQKQEDADACNPIECTNSPPAGMSTSCPGACTVPNC